MLGNIKIFVCFVFCLLMWLCARGWGMGEWGNGEWGWEEEAAGGRDDDDDDIFLHSKI